MPLDSNHSISGKKQTASSLQRIEQSRQLSKISKFNKDINASQYEYENSDMVMGKHKKSSAMKVLEYAKMFKNQGLSQEQVASQAKNSQVPSTSNNLEYRDLKNFNWINEKMNNEKKPPSKLDRPCTRGGDMRGLDFSFIEPNKNNDLIQDGSYFDRPVTRSKPRRPVSRQLRLNKRAHNLKGNHAESESFRGMSDLGECEPPTLKEKMNVHLIQKVIPKDSKNSEDNSISPIKADKTDAFMDRKRSLRDSTSLDPKLKVNKSINFNHKNSNTQNKVKKNEDSSQSTIDSKKNFGIGELNKSIRVMKSKEHKN